MSKRKRELLPIGLLIFLTAGFMVPAASQDQLQRPKFYALQVVCEKNVQNAKDSLGAPDGRYAEILPGGQLVVLMQNKLIILPTIGWPDIGLLPDSGSIVGKQKTGFGLEGWFPMLDTQGKQRYDWLPLAVSMSGFCLFPPPTYSFERNTGVDMIRITNPGPKSLFIDAVIGFSQDA
jgi:hypothetical protein